MYSHVELKTKGFPTRTLTKQFKVATKKHVFPLPKLNYFFIQLLTFYTIQVCLTSAL